MPRKWLKIENKTWTKTFLCFYSLFWCFKCGLLMLPSADTTISWKWLRCVLYVLQDTDCMLPYNIRYKLCILLSYDMFVRLLRLSIFSIIDVLPCFEIKRPFLRIPPNPHPPPIVFWGFFCHEISSSWRSPMLFTLRPLLECKKYKHCAKSADF